MTRSDPPVDTADGASDAPGRGSGDARNDIQRSIEEGDGRMDASDPSGTSGSRKEIRVPGKQRLQRIARSAGSRQASAYQGAMEAGFAVLIASLVGYWADEHFGTTPRWLIVGAIVGFASMVLRLVRMRSIYEQDAADDAPAGERGRTDAGHDAGPDERAE